MKNISLNGLWRFLGRAPQPLAPEEVALPDSREPDWLVIPVPGDVNQALLDHGRIPDPHYDVNARDLYWVVGREWWYETTFDYDMRHAENVELFLDGVDGPADAWLNGRYIGAMANYFHPHAFGITETLRPQGNRLLIRFQSLGRLLGDQDLTRMQEGRASIDGGSWIRKPHFSFGWDWALPLPSIGLGGTVALRVDNRKRFHDFGYRPFASGRIDFFFEVSRAARDAGYEIVLQVKGHGARIRECIAGALAAPRYGHGANGPESAAARYRSYATVQVPQPRLWWPNGYGEAALYEYEAVLVIGGEAVDVRRGRLGLREVEIVEAPFRPESGPGMSFELKVNGTAIFCKGANMVPFEIWPANTTDAQTRFYLEKCREAHFNMIRVWGGSYYEREHFYDVCDRLGLMVWQDFMFASAGYPLPRLRDHIIKEAEFQIRRLRRHACVVLWCGCNEDVFSWEHPFDTAQNAQRDTNDMNPDPAQQAWKTDRLRYDPELYGMLLRGLVGQLGMGIPYVESSPTSHDDIGNAPNSGNSHISVLKYALFQAGDRPETFRRYFEQVCSFDSEFCVHGPCAVASLKRFLAPENLWPPNQAWIFHIQRGHYGIPYYEQTQKLAGPVFGPMDDLETFVKHGQALHAEMMRGEFEHARRNRPDCGGTMFWMYNDCWPTSNWSVIDYYRVPKPAYYAAKRACAPVLPIVMERHGLLEFFLSNESAAPIEAEYCYGPSTLEGKVGRTRTKRFSLAANSVRKVGGLEKRKNELPCGSFWFVRAVIDGEPLPTVTYFPDCWKNIAWPQPEISLRKLGSVRGPNGRRTTRLEVTSTAFARFCHLTCADDSADAWFSDNYFDLPAGETRTISIDGNAPLKRSTLTVGHWLTAW